MAITDALISFPLSRILKAVNKLRKSTFIPQLNDYLKILDPDITPEDKKEAANDLFDTVVAIGKSNRANGTLSRELSPFQFKIIQALPGHDLAILESTYRPQAIKEIVHAMERLSDPNYENKKSEKFDNLFLGMKQTKRLSFEGFALLPSSEAPDDLSEDA